MLKVHVPDREAFGNARLQLATGRYDPEGWRRFLHELGRCTAEERVEMQEWVDPDDRSLTLGGRNASYRWVDAIHRYVNRFGQDALAGDTASPFFELLSALYANIRPSSTSMEQIEAACRKIRRNEIGVLFGTDPWLHNLALSFWEYAAGATRLESYPWNITIPVADLCNARCSFCTSWLDGRELITLEQVEALRDVVSRAVYLGLVGHGEPLAHPKFVQIADRLGEYLDPRATLYTITNGFFINRLLDKLEKINVRSYSISLNAASAVTHDKVMGLGPRAFDEVISGLRRLVTVRKTDDPTLLTYITMVVTAENVQEVADFVELGNEIDVSGIWIRSLLPQGQLIPGLNYHTLSPTLHPEFEHHRARAIAAIGQSRVPVQADPAAWGQNVLSPGLQEEVKRNPPTFVTREDARRDRDMRDRNEHLYRVAEGTFRGRRRGNAAGTVVTLSQDGVQFSTAEIPYSYAFSVPVEAGETRNTDAGRRFEVDLQVERGKVGVGLLDTAANAFLDRKFVTAGFDGTLELTAPDGRELRVLLENGNDEGGVSVGQFRKVTWREPVTAESRTEGEAAEQVTEVPLLSLTTHNSVDPLEDGLNPLGRMPRFACKAVYYNLYINEMFFRINPCCYMTEVPGFEEIRFDRNTPFMEAWNSPALVDLRTRLRDGPLYAACRRCPEKW